MNIQEPTDLTQEVLSRLDAIAAELKTTSAEILRLYAERYVAEGVGEISLAVMILITSAVTLVLLARLWTRAKRAVDLNNASGVRRYSFREEDLVTDHPEVVLPVVLGGIVAIVAGVRAFFDIRTGITYLIAPDSYAVQELMHQIF